MEVPSNITIRLLVFDLTSENLHKFFVALRDFPDPIEMWECIQEAQLQNPTKDETMANTQWLKPESKYLANMDKRKGYWPQIEQWTQMFMDIIEKDVAYRAKVWTQGFGTVINFYCRVTLPPRKKISDD